MQICINDVCPLWLHPPHIHVHSSRIYRVIVRLYVRMCTNVEGGTHTHLFHRILEEKTHFIRFVISPMHCMITGDNILSCLIPTIE